MKGLRKNVKEKRKKKGTLNTQGKTFPCETFQEKG